MALRKLLALLSLLALAWPARADFYIVVHASNPQHNLTHKEVVDLFMGRSRAFANGDFALIFDLPRDNPRRAAFYQALTGMSAAQVNSYWSRLMFSGQSVPPQALPDEAAMLGILRRNPSALGWLSREPADAGLRTVLVIKEPAR
ncbi:hypothetical protein [Roseateles saccharophilus]|uniref:Phosphate ABC transporter substrate-binding protein n=1 Tax=Roseateles saccharophilus TaxID=304 RepID=A0A4R3VFC0_ROSSA|nr:hypothetical protein [Roseateles saccharophilus]MDG0832276.1 hypothetical protein [Roseateles saccharophilus]TCV02349.1 hypothetical protein EV671_1004122 [Roseateles saccharophilus]